MAEAGRNFAFPIFCEIHSINLNGGGQTPHGPACGVPTVNVNPSGKAPPGQN
jgi:hypothetical protein